MLKTITLLTSYSFAAIYPLCFLISADNPLKNNFHRFHLGLPLFIGGIVVVYSGITGGFDSGIMVWSYIWIIALAIVAFYYWNKPYPNPYLVAAVCLAGMHVFGKLLTMYFQTSFWMNLIVVLGAFIFCACIYAMNLGHFYLNVHGLPLSHLHRATYVFWILVVVRFIVDVTALFTQNIIYAGEKIILLEFLTKMDGLFLSVAFLFGTLLPLVCLYFVHETIKLKNTQSATGILYVILSGLLIGDMTYKYYLFKFTILL